MDTGMGSCVVVSSDPPPEVRANLHLSAARFQQKKLAGSSALGLPSVAIQ
jgi:hypothetical protein